MRKTIIYLLAVLLTGVVALQGVMAATPSAQDEQVGQLLERVAQYVKRLGAYSADFKVVAGDYTTRGRYDVSGDRYYIVLDNAEVYSRRMGRADERSIVRYISPPTELSAERRWMVIRPASRRCISAT